MNEREDYLDRLLRGAEDGPEDGDRNDELSGFGGAGDDEDDFLKAFERSMAGGAQSESSDTEDGPEIDFNMDDIDTIVNNVKHKALDDDMEESQGAEDGGAAPDDLSGGGSLLDMISNMEAEENAQMEEDASQGDLDSLAQQLAQEMDGLDLGGAEEGDSLAEPELSAEPGEEADGDGQEKKKPGFFRRLAIALFGEDEEETEAAPSEGGDGDAAGILNDLDPQAQDAPEDEKTRKKREKQEKKEQKKKEKAEKKAQKEKEKQAKPKKEKKEKKPKEPKVVEKSKPLPKVPVILIFLVAASIVLLLHLLTSQMGYTVSVAQAEEYYEEGNYVRAYDSFARGSKVKEVHEDLYNRSRLNAYVQQQIFNYRAYQNQGMYLEALNALICGVGRYDINAEQAAAAGAEAEYEEMIAELQQALDEHYGMGLDEARELFQIRDKEEYTYVLYELMERMGFAE